MDLYVYKNGGTLVKFCQRLQNMIHLACNLQIPHAKGLFQKVWNLLYLNEDVTLEQFLP